MTDFRSHVSEITDLTIHAFMYLDIYINLFWHYSS